MRSLLDSLGEVETDRFIALLLREPFDYTQWQRELWAGKSVEEISAEAERFRKERESG